MLCCLFASLTRLQSETCNLPLLLDSYEILEDEQLPRRFPIWAESDAYAVYQKESGLVDAARGNSTHIQLAEENGATVLENAAVARIDRQKDGMISVCLS